MSIFSVKICESGINSLCTNYDTQEIYALDMKNKFYRVSYGKLDTNEVNLLSEFKKFKKTNDYKKFEYKLTLK